MQIKDGGKSSKFIFKNMSTFLRPTNKKFTLQRQKAVHQREPEDPECREEMAVLCCKT
jgi:hypothetical protein